MNNKTSVPVSGAGRYSWTKGGDFFGGAWFVADQSALHIFLDGEVLEKRPAE